MSRTDFYIDGAWVAPRARHPFPVENPATQTTVETISLGAAADIDRAVQAAARAFPAWSARPLGERRNFVERLLALYQARFEDMAQAISTEMGAPISMARSQQAAVGVGHLQGFLSALDRLVWEETLPNGDVQVREPIGVVGLITPWNWPMNQIALKVVPALLAGCACVLKPSEIAPLSAMLWADMIHEAGFPAGVFNLVNGEGAVAGAALSQHPLVAMMSFTGSTRAGTAVSIDAAPTVKRVTLELGGKSPNLVFADCDLETRVAESTLHCFNNTGQSCNAPTRMLVERSVYPQAIAIAARAAQSQAVGDPSQEGDHIGPLVSDLQWQRVQTLIAAGIAEGARLVAGGPGKPDGLPVGHFVRPTIFADVTASMRIWREEIFGPVLAMMPFDDEAQAIALANDTDYGLAAYIQTGDDARARRVARALRAGMIHVNGADHQYGSPFGGYKLSGNGREGGLPGLEDFLEIKTLHGLTLPRR